MSVTPKSPPNGAPFLGVERSFKDRTWRSRLDPSMEAVATAMAQRHGLSDALSRILAARNVLLDDVETYTNPTLRSELPDPHVMTDMKPASERIADAILMGETVAIFGDYDVDGASSTALLNQFLSFFDIDCQVYIPDRVAEGYGPNAEAIDQLIEDGATLVVTVDCGTTSFDALAHAKKRQVDVVVVDHHQAGLDLPHAFAIVNPNRQDDQSGLGHLAAVGVCFLVVVDVVRTLRRRGYFDDRTEPNLLQLVDLVALGTVCDVVPLIGVNRAFVVKGLLAMRQTPRPGLAALAASAGLRSPIDSGHLGYLIGPRINAGGRIGDAALGSKLLVERDMDHARKLADQLHQLNKERQAIETAAVEKAIDEVAKDVALGRQSHVSIVADPDWHPGIVGLVAARLKERLNLPAFALAVDNETGIATGSGRSISNVDLGEAVRAAAAEGLVAKGGGHAMAAGLTIMSDRVADLRAFLSDRLSASIDTSRSNNALVIDGAMTSGGATVDLIQSLDRAGPFGAGNPAPVFAFPAHRVTYAEPVGTGHVRLALSSGIGAPLKAIAFRAFDSGFGDALLAAMGKSLHVAGTLDVDYWGGSPKPQLRLLDAAVPTDRM